MKKGNLFGYVQSNHDVPENLRADFGIFPPSFNNTSVSKIDIGDLVKMHPEKEGIMSLPRKTLISSFALQNGNLNTPHLLFYAQLGLVITKIPSFVESTAEKCFNCFVQSAVDAGGESDDNPNSNVVA